MPLASAVRACLPRWAGVGPVPCIECTIACLLLDFSRVASVARVHVRAVTLDFGGTLDGQEHWRERFWRLVRAAGLEPSWDDFAAAFGAATRAAYAEDRLQRAGLDELVRYHFAAQLQALGIPWTSTAETIAAKFASSVRNALALHKPLLEHWCRRVRLGVISNFYGNLPRILDEAGLTSVFTVVLDSNLVGVRKPAPEIFGLAVGALGVRADEVLHVGDSLVHDVRGALAAGLQAAWLTRTADEEIAGALPPGAVRIAELRQLEAFLPCTPQ